MRSKTTDKQ